MAELRIRHARLPTPAVIVCADEIGAGKPDPEGFRTAARRLGIEPERCVVVEDAPPGIEAAHAASMYAIGVVGTYEGEHRARAEVTVPGVRYLEVQASGRGLRVILSDPPASER